MNEAWFVFYYGAQELFACTVRGSFPGELRDIISLLSAEKGISQDQIRIEVKMRKSKR